MSSSFESKDDISLSNCQIHASREEYFLQIMLRWKLHLRSLINHYCPLSKEASFYDLGTLVVGEEVTLTVKVKSVDPPQDVKNREGTMLKKQDCIIGDVNGCGRMVVWEDDVGKMIEGGSYKHVGVTVRSFRGLN